MGRSIDYFAPVLPFNALRPVALCNVLGSTVPLMLDAIERRKGYVHWPDRDTAADAYNELSRQQWELLMDAREDIIREIREARGPLLPGTESTLEAYPVGDYPGFTIGDVARRLGPAGADLQAQLELANATLVEVRDAIVAGGNGEALLAELVKISALLAV